jgi:hypothetical protein
MSLLSRTPPVAVIAYPPNMPKWIPSRFRTRCSAIAASFNLSCNIDGSLTSIKAGLKTIRVNTTKGE